MRWHTHLTTRRGSVEQDAHKSLIKRFNVRSNPSIYVMDGSYQASVCGKRVKLDAGETTIRSVIVLDGAIMLVYIVCPLFSFPEYVRMPCRTSIDDESNDQPP